MKITDVKCAIIGQNPIVRLVTDAGLPSFSQDGSQVGRIVDIRISGVSQLALTRAQFAGILREKGLEALIAMLREKIRDFSQNKKG